MLLPTRKISSLISSRGYRMFTEIKTEKGILKYRMPNILEAYDLLDASGITSGETSNLKLKKNIISFMGGYIDFSGIEGITKYEELFEDVENMMQPLSEIADLMVAKCFTVFKKKSL